MSIKLNWVNRNKTPLDAILIYRSPTPFTPQTLPETPIATLSGTAEEFIDENVERGKMYYYGISSRRGDDHVLGQVIPYAYYPSTGPGPQKIVRGNWEYGYFGEVEQSDFLTFQQVYTATNGLVSGNFVKWHKCAFQGKVLFIMESLCGSSTWNNLYNAGLVYGVDGFGARVPQITLEVNQRKPITFGTDSFLMRLPKGSTLPTNTFTSGSGVVNSEADLISNIFDMEAFAGKRFGNVVKATAANYFLTQHMYTLTSGVPYALCINNSMMNSVNTGAPTSTYYFRLVLELEV